MPPMDMTSTQPKRPFLLKGLEQSIKQEVWGRALAPLTTECILSIEFGELSLVIVVKAGQDIWRVRYIATSFGGTGKFCRGR